MPVWLRKYYVRKYSEELEKQAEQSGARVAQDPNKIMIPKEVLDKPATYSTKLGPKN
jgi:hypothetical protein